jgi:cell division cycle 14
MAFLCVHPDKICALKRTFESLRMTSVSSDLHKQYTSFCADFGPVNLSIVFRFHHAMCTKLAKVTADGGVLLYCIEPEFDCIANSAFLLGAFLLLHTGCSPAEAAEPFMGSSAPFDPIPFRDATFAPQDFDLTLLDCLEGLARAVALGWFDVKTFDLQAFQVCGAVRPFVALCACVCSAC